MNKDIFFVVNFSIQNVTHFLSSDQVMRIALTMPIQRRQCQHHHHVHCSIHASCPVLVPHRILPPNESHRHFLKTLISLWVFLPVPAADGESLWTNRLSSARLRLRQHACVSPTGKQARVIFGSRKSPKVWHVRQAVNTPLTTRQQCMGMFGTCTRELYLVYETCLEPIGVNCILYMRRVWSPYA